MVTERPELFDLRIKARALAYLFAAGASLAALTLVLPHDPEFRDAQIWVVVGVAAVVAVALFRYAEVLTDWQVQVGLAIGTTLLGFANYYSGTSTLYSLLYTWAGLFAFYFFTRSMAIAHTAYIGASYAIVLAANEAPSPAVRWLLAVGTPLVAGLLVSQMLDRLRAEQAEAEARGRELRESEARTRLVLDSSPDAFITLDSQGVIRGWNKTAERMFGWSADEAIGQQMRTLITPAEHRDRHDERRRALIGTEPEAPTHYEGELQRRDGSRFPAESTVSRVEVRGELLVAGFIRDVTDRLRQQEEREELLREQAARAEAERVAELVSGMQLLVDAALAHRTLGDIVSDLVTRVRTVLDADAASIFLADERSLTLAAVAGGETPAPADAPLPFGEGFAGRVAAQRAPLLLQDPAPEQLPYPELEKLQIDSVIGLPLLAEGDVTGVLVVCAATPRHFSADDVSLLRLAADRVALAVDHARVYEREHRIAETLQRSLLPDRLPQLPGLSVAARYLPAASEAEVGGDWYDVIPIAGGGVGLVMGDVAGKGLAGASMVGRLRSALRAYALEAHDGSRVVERLNRVLWTEGQDSQMATMLYVVVDPAAGTVRWVNAGHPPPLVMSRGDVRFLEGQASVPLGVLPFPTYEEVTARLDPGDALLLYTDGLVERPGEHLDIGLEQLTAAVREAPHDPQGLLDHLLATLVPAVGSADDVALLTLSNLPVPEEFTAEFPAEPESLALIRSMLRRWLAHAGADDVEIAEITTACGEAATNAIEHAGITNGARFEVAGRRDAGEIAIAVRDRGSWRSERDDDHGRGLDLMRTLMDTVSVEPGEQGTTVSLRRRLGHGR